MKSFPNPRLAKAPILLATTLGLSAAAPAFERQRNSSLNLPSEQYSGYTLEADPLFSPAENPMQVLPHPTMEGAFYVLERSGQILCLAPGQAPVVALDITAQVGSTQGELGLLTAALHPAFPQQSYIYLYYTTYAAGQITNRLARYEVAADRVTINEDSGSILIDQPDAFTNHNGGTLLFGHDGYLYLSLGDGGGSTGREDNTQKIDDDFFSAVLRIDVDNRPDSLPPNPHASVHGGYSIPPDNPYVGATSFNGSPVDPASLRTEFYAVGLRNPFRMGTDQLTGDIWIGDVGQSTYEEINRLQPGANYGWPVYEGPQEYSGSPVPGVGYTPPIYYYGRDAGYSVTGGFVYRGSEFPELYGAYLFADLSGRLWAARFSGDDTPQVEELTSSGNPIIAVQPDPRDGGGVIIVFLDRSIHTLKRRVSETFDPPQLLSQTGVFSNLAELELAPGFESYEVNVPFWSDNALKWRAFYIPAGQQIGYQPYDNWSLPSGSVWMKHFTLELEEGNPASAVRVETRFIVKTDTGAYGITYRWNEAQDEAFLVDSAGEDVEYQIQTTDGGSRSQVWQIPSRAQCIDCHTAVGGHALSFTTQQLNRLVDGQNQLSAMAAAGYFNTDSVDPVSAPRLYATDDESASLTDRAKSYLEANCANCHQPGGPGAGEWDARAKTMLALSKIIYGDLERGPVQGTHVVVPNDPGASAILQRINRRGHAGQMPPFATSLVDEQGVVLIERWINEGLDNPHDWDKWFMPAEGSLWVNSWYGWFWQTPGSDFIYHLEHGWQYMLPLIAAGDGWDLYYWDYGVGSWLYTRNELNGWTYHFSSASWLYYVGSEGGLRYFWNSNAGGYVTFP